MNYINPNDDPSLPKFSDIRDTTRRFVILLTVLALLAAGGVLAGKPVYRWFKTQRALALVKQGEAAAAEGKWDEAGRVVQTVLRLAPAETRVLRLAARYCSENRLLQGLSYWQTVEAREGLTLDERYDYARLALSYGRTDLSAQMLTSLLATNRTQNDPRVMRLTALHSEAVGNIPDAIRAARSWFSEATGDPDAEMVLGSLLLGRPNAPERQEGRGLLWGLALGDGKYKWRAVELLAASNELNQGEHAVLLKQVEGNTNQIVTAHDLRVKLSPGQRKPLTDQLIQTVIANGNQGQLAKAAAWLADQGEVARVLEVLPPSVAEKNPVLLTARLQALMELGRFDEVKRFLQQDTTRVEPFMLHCLRAFAAQGENKPQLVAGYFENAITEAGNQPARLRFVAGYAERVGQPQAAIAAYRRLMNWPPATVESAQQILRLATQINDTRAIRDTMRFLANFMPGERNIAIANGYLAALLNEAAPRHKDDLLRFANAQATEPELTFVVAFVELRLGESGPALTRLESLKPEWLLAEPRRQAVYAATLGANDQREAARRLARTLDSSKLRPEERDLIKPWL